MRWVAGLLVSALDDGKALDSGNGVSAKRCNNSPKGWGQATTWLVAARWLGLAAATKLLWQPVGYAPPHGQQTPYFLTPAATRGKALDVTQQQQDDYPRRWSGAGEEWLCSLASRSSNSPKQQDSYVSPHHGDPIARLRQGLTICNGGTH